MNRFIKIGNLYYNLEKIENIGFKTIENSLTSEKVAHYIIINNVDIFVNEEEYYKIKLVIERLIEVVL